MREGMGEPGGDLEVGSRVAGEAARDAGVEHEGGRPLPTGARRRDDSDGGAVVVLRRGDLATSSSAAAEEGVVHCCAREPARGCLEAGASGGEVPKVQAPFRCRRVRPKVRVAIALR